MSTQLDFERISTHINQLNPNDSTYWLLTVVIIFPAAIFPQAIIETHFKKDGTDP